MRRLITIPCGGRPPRYEITEQFSKEFLEYYNTYKIDGVIEKYNITERTAYRILKKCREHGKTKQ